jgi:hypothetical protein
MLFVTKNITLNVVVKLIKDYFNKKSDSYYNKQKQSKLYFSIKSLNYLILKSIIEFKMCLIC